MIKQINIKQLRKGMYIHDLKCSWLDHPFTISQFKISRDSDIKKIINAGIKKLEIDTAKGLDIFHEKRKPENEQLRQAIDKSLVKIPVIKKAYYNEELKYAKEVFNEAGILIKDVMDDVKKGKEINIEAVDPVVEKMSASIERNQNALVALSRIRDMDKYTFEHSISVSILIMSLAKNMKMDSQTIKQLGLGGLLHDIGKSLTPDQILNKPGKLTADEFIIMRTHVVDSKTIVDKTKQLSQLARDVVSQHHERYDGMGYPNGLKADEISQAGQMAAVVDVYDAITADRCYHKGKDPCVALKLLVKWSQSHFNPKLVQHFIKTIGVYPVGSLVLLNNGHLAKVLEVNDDILSPVVEIFLDTKKRSYIAPQIIDLNKNSKLKVLSSESYDKWNIK